MEKTKLFYALSSLDQRQRQDFTDFISSPFFNKRADVVRLWEVLRLHGIREGETSEALFEKVFPGEKYNSDQFNKLKTRLLNQFYAFLSHARLKDDPSLELLLQVKALNEQKNSALIQARIRKAERMLEKREAQDAEHFFLQMELEFEKNIQLHDRPRRPEKTNTHAIAQNLEHGFLAQAFKLNYALQNENKILGMDHEWDFIRENWSRLVEREAEFPPLVRLYLHLNGLFQDEHPRHFNCLHELLRTHAESISHRELQSIYTGALNYCARKMNCGFHSYEAEYFKLASEMIVLGILVGASGSLSPWMFKNITTVAVRLGEFDWAKEFIETHARHIDPVKRKAAIAYNMGLYYFYTEDFESAQRELHRLLQFGEDIFYHLDGRAFLLRTYYHTGDAQAMESLLHSFRMYINRNKQISKTHKENYLTFIKFFRRLINTPSRDRKRIGKLREDVVGTNWNSAGKRWIVEELESMTKS